MGDRSAMPMTLSRVGPGLPGVMPSDTTVPGWALRHVWAAPELASHSVLVLTLPRIYLAPGTEPPKPERIAVLEKSYDLETTLGPRTTAIDLASIRRVRLDLIN